MKKAKNIIIILLICISFCTINGNNIRIVSASTKTATAAEIKKAKRAYKKFLSSKGKSYEFMLADLGNNGLPCLIIGSDPIILDASEPIYSGVGIWSYKNGKVQFIDGISGKSPTTPVYYKKGKLIVSGNIEAHETTQYYIKNNELWGDGIFDDVYEVLKYQRFTYNSKFEHNPGIGTSNDFVKFGKKLSDSEGEAYYEKMYSGEKQLKLFKNTNANRNKYLKISTRTSTKTKNIPYIRKVYNFTN